MSNAKYENKTNHVQPLILSMIAIASKHYDYIHFNDLT